MKQCAVKNTICMQTNMLFMSFRSATLVHQMVNPPHPHTQTVSLILLFSASFKHNYPPATDWFPAQVKSRCQATYKHNNKFLGHTIMVVVCLHRTIECVQPVVSHQIYLNAREHLLIDRDGLVSSTAACVCPHTLSCL